MVEVTKVRSQVPSEARDSYSRVVVVDDWAFVSITAGVQVTPRHVPHDPAEQAHKMIDNVQASLEAIGFELGDVVKAQVIIGHPRDFEAVIAVFGERFRGIDPANTVHCAPLGSSDLRVEMEATAYRGVAKAQQKRVQITL
jgi:enamine deaminase RidA (YjgF/YER057c/UK114 family)